MRYKMLASLVVSAGLVLAISGTAQANGPTSPTITYTVIDKTVSHDWNNLGDRIGGCTGATGGTCTVASGTTATNTFGVSLGITVDELAEQLSVSTARTVQVSVSCTSPVLSAGEHWYAYAAGTLYTYKVQRRSDVGGGIPRITTSGWETTFKASPSLIYCTNS